MDLKKYTYINWTFLDDEKRNNISYVFEFNLFGRRF